MYDFSRLQVGLNRISAAAAKLRNDVITLRARIEALEAQVDPTAQSQLDAMSDSAEQIAVELEVTDALTPEVPPPGPPA